MASEALNKELETLRQRICDLEQALDQSQHMLQLIIDNLPGAVFWKDRNSVYQGCNQLFATFAGVGTPAGIVGKTDYDLSWKPEESEAFRRDDEQVMRTNTPKYHIIEPQQQADGKQSWLETNKIPLNDANGNVVGILGTYEDITDRMEAHRVLERSEARFRALVENITVATLIHQDGHIRYVNPVTEALTGYTSQQSQTMSIADFVHPDFHQIMWQHAEARQRGEQALFRYEIKIITSSGAERWVELTSHGIEFEGQSAVLVTALDVTERKQMIESVQRSEARFRTLIEQNAVATLIHTNGQVLYANPAAEGLAGYTLSELLTLSVWEIIHPDFRAIVQTRSSARLKGEQVTSRYEIKIVRKDGMERWVDLTASPVEFEGQTAILVTFLDITEQKHHAEERIRLQSAILQARESALRELSTPLIPITDQIMVMPLIGRLDADRVQQVMETLVQGVATHSTQVAIVDLTGVPVADSHVVNVLMQAARAVQLLGAEVILTGIRPDIAQRLIELNSNLSGIITRSTLQAGIAYAVGRNSVRSLQHRVTNKIR